MFLRANHSARYYTSTYAKKFLKIKISTILYKTIQLKSKFLITPLYYNSSAWIWK